MGSTTAPVLPQLALIASATAVGYAPELLPFELCENLVIVSFPIDKSEATNLRLHAAPSVHFDR